MFPETLVAHTFPQCFPVLPYAKQCFRLQFLFLRNKICFCSVDGNHVSQFCHDQQHLFPRIHRTQGFPPKRRQYGGLGCQNCWRRKLERNFCSCFLPVLPPRKQLWKHVSSFCQATWPFNLKNYGHFRDENIYHYIYMANWSATKRSILIGSLSGLNFAIRTAKMDRSQTHLAEFLLWNIEQKKTVFY